MKCTYITVVVSFIIGFFTQTNVAFGQISGWQTLDKVKFAPKYFELIKTELPAPVPDDYSKAIDNKEIIVKGYYIPIDTEHNLMILSKFPYKMCFFCGGAGPSSVVQVHMFANKKPPIYPTDKLVKVKGKLKVNYSNLEQLNFVINDAVEIKE